MKVEIVKELDSFKEKAVLVKAEDGRFFAVSTVGAAFDTGLPETLVFEADEDGEVTDWGGVAGGQNLSREMAIIELEGALDGGPRSPRPGVFGALLDVLEENEEEEDEETALD